MYSITCFPVFQSQIFKKCDLLETEFPRVKCWVIFTPIKNYIP